jgi:Family of unknown function (DUF5908)
VTIEIKQLVIRAVVESRGEQQEVHSSESRTASPQAAARNTREPGISSQDRAAIVTACMREILRKLERSRQR